MPENNDFGLDADDYITLQGILVRLRVLILKEISKKDLNTKRRDPAIKMLRSVDNLRKIVPLKIDKEVEEGAKNGNSKNITKRYRSGKSCNWKHVNRQRFSSKCNRYTKNRRFLQK